MNAAVNVPTTVEAQRLLYAWGDECRSKADALGLPRSSGIARVIEQQRIQDRRRRGVRARRKRDAELRQPIRLRDGVMATICVCGLIILDGERCPRCNNDPRAPDRSVHATQTRSFRPLSIGAISADAIRVDAIVATAPNWMRKVLMLAFLWVERDKDVAIRLRIRMATYLEQKNAAVEYVAEQLARHESGVIHSPASPL